MSKEEDDPLVGSLSSQRKPKVILVANAQLTFNPDKEDSFIRNLYISRVQLNDRHLSRLSAVVPEDFDQYWTDPLCRHFINMDISDSIPGFVAEAELNVIPKQFGSTQNKCAHNQKKRRVAEFSWVHEVSFEEYWQDFQYYAGRKVWLLIQQETMDPSTRNQFFEETERARPRCLLEAHVKGRAYDQFAKAVKEDPRHDTEEWNTAAWNIILDVIEKQVKEAFLLEQARLRTGRCRQFLKKLCNLGVEPGYRIKEDFETNDPLQDADIDSDSSNAPPDEMSSKEDSGVSSASVSQEAPSSSTVGIQASTSDEPRPPTKKKRETEVFSEVKYRVYEQCETRLVLNRRNLPTPLEEGEIADNKDGEETSSTIVPVEENLQNISFNFDPVKDADLLAKDAYKTFKNDPEIRKYWFQRYRLFSKLNDGVIMDREGWFSVTPEEIAKHIAHRMVKRKNAVVLDAFAGVGGNSIQLAKKGAYVIAIDLDPVRLKCAKRNAEVYGVADRIEFICGNFFHIAARWSESYRGRGEIDAIFLSPPWGGPSYLQAKEFDIGDGCCPNGFDIFNACRLISPNIAFFLPRNTKMSQLISLVAPGGGVEIEQSCLNKKIKTITAYYGNLCKKSNRDINRESAKGMGLGAGAFDPEETPDIW